jgi:hypothetical protein
MKKSFVILFLMLCVFLTQGQAITVKIDYIYNNNTIALNDDFEVFFIVVDSTQKIIIKPKIIQNTFEVPNFCDKMKGHIVFKYKKTVLWLGINTFDFTQNMIWEIGFKKKKYYNEYDIEKKTKGIAYIAFHPLEKGDGAVTTISINDFNRYFKESKELLK